MALREAPKDSLEVPLPIIPSEDFPYLKPGVGDLDLTRHHEFYLFGSRKFPTLELKILRACRILRAERAVHNNGPRSFHGFFKQSSGPRLASRLFDIPILTSAGYYPSEGVDLWNGRPEVRPIEPWEMEILQTLDDENPLRYRNLSYEAPYLSHYYGKKIRGMDTSVVEEEKLNLFTEAADPDEIVEYGSGVFRSLIEQSTEHLETEYQSAYEDGRLHPLAGPTAADALWRVFRDDNERAQEIFALRTTILNRALQKQVKVIELQVA